MGNADEDQEHDETPLTPRCGYCGDPMFGQRNGAVYCDRRCKELARERRKRDRAQVDMLREKYPLADQSLMELYARSTPPRSADEDQGDEAGPDYADDEADDGPGAWNDEMALQERLAALTRDAERRAAPYLQQLRRNPGVYPAPLAGIQNEYSIEYRRLVSEHEGEKARRKAERDSPLIHAAAADRIRGQQALQAFAQDLGRGHRAGYESPSAGRATRDIWRW